MDFSKLKLELYDFFGILVPGLILVSDIWIMLDGWTQYLQSLSTLSANALTALLLISYVAGHLVQEAGDVLVHLVMGSRHLKGPRDTFWAQDGHTVRAAIKKEAGIDISSVDLAYDYCLSKAKDLFTKRDAFIATSDLAR